MKKPFLPITLLLVAAIISPLPVFAGSIAEADASFEQGGMVNVANSIDGYEQILTRNPDNFEKVYELDKMYDDGGSILALGRFWAVLPWPLYNNEKALAYYREFQQTEYFQSSTEGRVYLSKLLIRLGGDRKVAEARDLISQAILNGEPYFTDWAQRLLNKMD